MNRRPSLILVGLIIAGMIGVALLAIPASPLHQKATLGLDLQGGLEVTLKAVPPPNRPLQKSDLDRSVEILRDRVDRLGVAEPEIRKQGDDQIVIDLPGVKDPARVIGILGQTAQLELFDLEANLAPPSNSGGFASPKESLYELLAGQQALVKDGTETNWYLFDNKKKLVAGPVTDRNKLLESDVVKDAGGDGKLPKNWKMFGVPPKTVVVSCGVGEVVCPGVGVENPTKNVYYLLRYDPDNADPNKVVPEMTGADLKLAGTRQDFDTTTGEPIVTMQFTDEGADRFGEITNREADRGRARHNITGGQGDPSQSFQHFAIVLDRQIKSWPSIDFEQYPNGIGGCERRPDHRHRLAHGGEGPRARAPERCPARQVHDARARRRSRRRSVRTRCAEARNAAIAGLIAVALFLLIFYRFLGVVAVIGLAIYAAFMYGAILLFDVTLTLPGFAGLILTIGVAADANIVIFERIKEEARAGKSVRAAISAGYAQGLPHDPRRERRHCITALVLFARRDRRRQGLRADAADRHRDLAGDGGRRDARDARPARRLPLVRQPELHGRDGRAAEVAADRLHRPPPAGGS